MSATVPAKTTIAAASIPHHRWTILRDWSLWASRVDWPFEPQPASRLPRSIGAPQRNLAILPTTGFVTTPASGLRTLRTVMDPTRTALGTWSGGRFMHFGEALDDERLQT